MIVKIWMARKPLTFGLETSVLNAAEAMRSQQVRQFPVIDGDGALVGIVSDRDIRDAMPSKFLPGGTEENGTDLLSLTVAEIMTVDPVTVTPLTAMDVVADRLAKLKVGGLPVVENGTLVGIITEVDVFRFLTSATGLARGGVQLAVRLEACPGPLANLLATLRKQDAHFTSVLTSHDYDKAGYRHAYIRLESLGDHSIGSLVSCLSGEFDVLYYVSEGEAVYLEDDQT
ncbi:MAG: CBS and ACT domain-containing protein [Proteobacteria bacterium]|nr:CBS and ACT domain-containing protein [Pseudomonadota bacterium]